MNIKFVIEELNRYKSVRRTSWNKDVYIQVDKYGSIVLNNGEKYALTIDDITAIDWDTTCIYNHDILWAVSELEKGNKVTRYDWGKNIYLNKPNYNIIVYDKTQCVKLGNIVCDIIWNPTFYDLNATDYMLYKEEVNNET